MREAKEKREEDGRGMMLFRVLGPLKTDLFIEVFIDSIKWLLSPNTR